MDLECVTLNGTIQSQKKNSMFSFIWKNLINNICTNGNNVYVSTGK